MLLPHCTAASASSFLASEGLAASLGLAEPPHFIWVVPSGRGLGSCGGNNKSTTNPALDMIRLYKRKSSGLCLFLNTRRCNMDGSSAKPAPVLLETKLGRFLMGDNITAGENMLWGGGDKFSGKRSAVFRVSLLFSPNKQIVCFKTQCRNCYCFN